MHDRRSAIGGVRHQETDFPLGVRGRKALQNREVVEIHREQQIEFPEVRKNDLASAQGREVVASPPAGCLGSRVRGRPDVVIMRSRRVDDNMLLQPGPLHERPHYSFRGR